MKLKNKTWSAFVGLAGAIIALVALIIYIVNSTTGFYANSSFNAWPVVLTLVGIALVVVRIFLAEKIPQGIDKLITLLAVCALAGSFCLYIVSKLQVFADVYFIPVNYPPTEDAACSTAIAGIIIYVIATIASIVSGCGNDTKAE